MPLRLPHTICRRFLSLLALPILGAILGSAPLARAQFVYSNGTAVINGGSDIVYSGSLISNYAQNGGAVTFVNIPGGGGTFSLQLINNMSYTMTSGTLIVPYALEVGNQPVNGYTGATTITQLGGTATVTGGLFIRAWGSSYNLGGGTLDADVKFGGLTTNTGYFHLGGGLLKASTITGNTASNYGVFFFDSGTLQAKALGSGENWVVGNPSLLVSNGGAKIDTAGYNRTIGAQIGHDGSASAIDGGLTKLGEGTLTLSSTLSYTGNTTVEAGTLQLNSTTALISGTSALVVNGGTFALGAHSETMGSLSGTGGTVNLNSYNLSLVKSTSGTYAGSIIGSGILVKSGTGTLVLSGNNAHGGTAITAGMVQFTKTSALGGALLVASGATGGFNVGGTGEFAWSQISTLVDSSFQGGSKVALDTTNAAGGSYAISQDIADAAGVSSVGLVKLGSGTLALGGANSYSGGTRISAGTLQFTKAAALPAAGALAVDSGATGAFNVGGAGEFTWSGISAVSGAFQAGTFLGLDTTNAGGSFTVSSPIAGGFGLTKMGTGTLVLSGSNSFTGGLWVNGGLVEFANTSALGAVSGTLTLAGGGLRWATGNTADVSSRIRLGAGGGTIDTNGNNVTFATALTGSNGLTKTGAGALTFTSTNTYTGGTIVTGGTLRLNTGGSIGAIRGALTIGSGATVETAAVDALGYSDGLKVDSVTINGGTLNNTAAGDSGWGVAYTLSNGALLNSNGGVSSATSASMHAFGGPSTGNTSVNATSGTSTIAGHVDLRGDNGNTNVNLTVATGATLNITAGISSHSPDSATVGPVNLTKLGGGLLTLTGSNVFTGTAFVNAGGIEFNSRAAFGNTANKIIVNSGSLRWSSGNTADISSQLTLGAGGGTLDTNGNTVVFATALSGTGALTKTGTGFLRLTAQDAHSAGGDTTINGGVLALAGPVSTHGQLGGSGAKITINSGNINLEADNALMGTSPFANVVLTINSGGLLSTVNNVTNLAGVVLNGGVIDTAGGGNFTTGNYLFNNGVSTAGTGTLSRIQGGAVVLSSTVTVKANDTLQISSVIMGNNNLVKGDVGTLALTGSNTFTGTTVVNGGLIEFSSNTSFGNAANKVVLNGGGLRWATGNTADISSRFGALGATGATFDTNGNNVTFGSVLSGSGGLTKNGLGTLNLNAVNTYAGGTVINSGTVVAAQNNALGSGTVRLQGGSLNVQNGVTFTNSVVLASGTYSRTLTGSIAGKVNATSDLAGGLDTTASLLAGNLGTQSTLVTSFASTSAASNDNLRQSDVYSFVGTGTNIFVLQLSSATAGDDGILVWLDNGEWVNAINGNTGNTATAAMQDFDGSYSQFLAAFSSAPLSQTLGAYGYDASTESAWAVLNHNSDFAIIPEPSTVGLLLAGGGLWLLVRRKRRAA